MHPDPKSRPVICAVANRPFHAISWNGLYLESFYNRWKRTRLKLLFRNLVACHLFKAVAWWLDSGSGEYDLHYLRTKDKREVDFLVSKNGLPWFIVEVKSSQSRPLSKNLKSFKSRIGAQHAFQVVADAEYEDVDCFAYDYPVRVPARTFLSQLV